MPNETMGNTTPGGNTTPEEAQKGNMIPKARFDEVYAKLKDLERQVAAVTQQYGVQSLDQLADAAATKALDSAGRFIVDMVRETGVARNVIPFFRQRGINVPEIEQLAVQQPQQGAQGMDDLEDPYMSEIKALKQKLEQMEQMTQQERQQQIQQVLYNKMASAIQQVVPGAKGDVLDTLINIMADKAIRIVEGNPNLDWQTFVSQMDFNKMAQESVGSLQQVFTGGASAGISPPQAGQQGRPQVGTQQPAGQPTALPGDQGPVEPDKDVVDEAEVKDLYAAIAGEGEMPSEGPPA